ncbi:MAG: lysylphosphatidylglycerol synthase domain-containing protein, partial [Chitinivibrionales bacterium]
IIEDVRQGVYIYRDKKKTLFFVFLATMFIQLLLVGSTCLVLAGISGKWFPFECLAYVPLIEILSLSIPLTPSGLGIREALTKLMFQQIGLSNEQLGVYIVLGLLSIVLKLVGGVPVLFNLLRKSNSQGNPPQSRQTE